MPLHFSRSDPNPRFIDRQFPVVLVVETSDDELLKDVHRNLTVFQKSASSFNCMDIAVVSFDSSVRVERDFWPASDFDVPTLQASSSGLSVMNEGIEFALDAIEGRVRTYHENGILYHRPQLILIARGAATDADREDTVRSRLQEMLRKREINYMPVALGNDADIGKLKSYFPDEKKDNTILSTDIMDFMQASQWMGGCDEELPDLEARLDHAVSLLHEFTLSPHMKSPREMNLSYKTELPLRVQLPWKGAATRKENLPVEIHLSLKEGSEGHFDVNVSLVPAGSLSVSNPFSKPVIELPPVPGFFSVEI